MAKIFSDFTEEKWEQVRTHPYYAKARERALQQAETYLATEPPRIKFSQIHLYVTTGDRGIFQSVYANYEDRMRSFFFCYLLTQDEKYLEPLADILWNICDFESWSIPAHVAENLTPEQRRQNLDLCSTIMGMRVAEILYFIGDKLPDLVYRRAKAEVRYRVIDSYRKNTYWWMKALNNWSAVCIASVLATYLYVAEPEEIDEQLPRMIETANCYLRGIDDEGCCLEGYGYWNYGFSYFCLFATMLRDYTDGRIDMFREPKVHALALFQQNICLTERQCIPFSDCGGGGFQPYSWLSHLLKHEYPDMQIPPLAADMNAAPPLRYVLWSRPEYADCQMEPKSFIYREAQWFIHRDASYTLAAKAGHNNEPHNHNDVGSFALAKGGEVTFTDPGGGEYTRQYFSAERYSILEPSGRGHSTPIINGECQGCSEVRSTVRIEGEDEYAFDMHGAYPTVPTLQTLDRHFRCTGQGVTLTDTYTFTEVPASVTERFVSLRQPEKLEDGRVQVGNVILTYDPQQLTLVFRTEDAIRSFAPHHKVYFTDLEVRQPQKSFSVTVTFA